MRGESYVDKASHNCDYLPSIFSKPTIPYFFEERALSGTDSPRSLGPLTRGGKERTYLDREAVAEIIDEARMCEKQSEGPCVGAKGENKKIQNEDKMNRTSHDPNSTGPSLAPVSRPTAHFHPSSSLVY